MDPIGSYAPDADPRRLQKFNFNGCAGWDLVCSWFLSEHRFARRIAWKLTRPGGHYAGLDVSSTRFVIQMPHASYEITHSGEDARVAPCASLSLGGL